MDTKSIPVFIKQHTKNILEKKFILFLGPHFGTTREGKSVGDSVRAYLAENAPDLLKDIDNDFDSLFILKNPDPSRSLDLRWHLSEHYQSLEPGEIYETIARLPFRAIISCTPDLMLKKTFDNLKIVHEFYPKEHNGDPAGDPLPDDVIHLFNLFGDARNQDSLIVTYEDFFKFFVSLLSDNMQMPVSLQYVLQEAKFFMLLGFDLDKWYMPLIIRKLNKDDRTNTKKEHYSILTQDAPVKPENEYKLSTTFIVLQSDSEMLIKELDKSVSEHLGQPGPAGVAEPLDPGELRRHLIDQVEKLVRGDELKGAISLLLQAADQWGIDKGELIVQEGNLAGVERERNLNKIDYDQYSKQMALIRSTLSNIIKYLRSQPAPEG